MEDMKKQQDISKNIDKIQYSARYHDEVWEYRHVTLPKELTKYIPADRLMDEEEWRGLGVQQSLGWEHYLIHRPEPHVLLFRREKDYQLKYPHGKPNSLTTTTATTTTSSSSSSSSSSQSTTMALSGGLVGARR
ncbi:hypothetical protein HMI54_005808 [Coelomomyces lativittatus]|nr:hypothetical protein HMI56_005465 [Coelomomyces lativittatus]KAJ1500073.1 hypothetical protein HMI55_004062 [Coelomomyces lativittatus]KAJ1517373.1 hypothetical protein HMI54_005808 [Coelomomyces lativittatus]